MITFTTVKTETDLHQILSLQRENLEATITPSELQKEGFVTVNHSFELLKELNSPYPHIIAKDSDELVGYTLVMLKTMQNRIPILVSMFEKINSLTYNGASLKTTDYFAMGQVCIKKGYRGQGVFKGLYDEMKRQMSSHFRCIITEVATRNPRSIRAHQKQGFEVIHTYLEGEEEWVILLWDWKS